jgi:D-serine deaminase-like pyridoxal phosphate-dependent protein
MDDGTMQHFDTNADDLKIGDRIEITPNGTMRHPV